MTIVTVSSKKQFWMGFVLLWLKIVHCSWCK